MRVIFLEDVKNVAKAGDSKEVADGYARNYLFPKKLALLSKPGTATVVKKQIEARAETEKMKKLAADIDGKEITFKVKVGVKDRMHGSITAANISAELQNFTDYDIDKRKIELPETIKQLGSYDVAIKLAKGIEPKIKVTLIKKEEEPEKEAAKEPEKAEKKEE